MSLGNWEGEIDDEAEPEELPKIRLKEFCDGGMVTLYRCTLLLEAEGYF